MALIVGPVAFVPVFIVISAIMWIIHAIISGIAGFRKKKNNKLTRLFGMLLGLIQGTLVAIVLLTPILGIATLAESSIETIRAKDELNETETQIIEFYDENIKEAIESTPVQLFAKLGGKFMYNSLATIKVDGTSVDMPNELETVFYIYSEVENIESDMTALTKEEQESVERIADLVANSKYFSPLLAGAVSGATSMLEEDMLEGMEEPIRSVMVDFLAVFKTTTQDTIKGDLDTLFDFMFLFINDGVFSAIDAPETEDTDVTDVLFKTDANGVTTIDKAIAILDSNERTKPIVTSLVKLTMVYAKETLLDSFDSTGLDAEEIDKIYEDVKGSVNEIVKIDPESFETEEEYKDAVATSVEKMAIDNGFVDQAEIDANREEIDKVFDEVSDHIMENYAGKEEISDAELLNVITQYYNSYVNKENPAP